MTNRRTLKANPIMTSAYGKPEKVIPLGTALTILLIMMIVMISIAATVVIHYGGYKTVPARMVVIDPSIWKCRSEAHVQTGATLYDMTPTCIVWSNRP